MNLPSSLVVTSFIVAMVWLSLVFQPESAWAQAAQTNSSSQSSAAVDAEALPASKPVIEGPVTVKEPAVAASTLKMAELALEGISRSSDLSPESVANLWLEFADRYDLHRRLNESKVTTYALYQNFNSDFSRAEISVGYRSEDLNGKGQVIATLTANTYNELLAPARHSTEKIAMSWADIDYTRDVGAVLEKHQVNASGQVESSALYVLYR